MTSATSPPATPTRACFWAPLLLFAVGADGKSQTALWGAALLADYGGTYVGGASDRRLGSARHFAERHVLILIVALGKSIVAIAIAIAIAARPSHGRSSWRAHWA